MFRHSSRRDTDFLEIRLIPWSEHIHKSLTTTTSNRPSRPTNFTVTSGLSTNRLETTFNAQEIENNRNHNDNYFNNPNNRNNSNFRKSSTSSQRTSRSRSRIRPSNSFRRSESIDGVGENYDNYESEILRAHPDLKQDQTIPPYMYYGPTTGLTGIPLIEQDPYYRNQDTFIVVNYNLQLFRFNCGRSFYLMSPTNPIRRFAIRILTNPNFNKVIITTILFNCICMTKSQPDKLLVLIEDYFEIVFLIIYTCEMIIKTISRGFFIGNFCYLSDTLNVLDLFVIVTSYAEIFIMFWMDPGIPGIETSNAMTMKGLRALRVFRAMKAISVIPGLKHIIMSLIKSLKGLKDVMILTIGTLVIFSLISVQLFGGVLQSKCVVDHPGTLPELKRDMMTPGYKNQSTLPYDFSFPEDYNFLNPPMNCQPLDYHMMKTWEYIENPYYKFGQENQNLQEFKSWFPKQAFSLDNKITNLSLNSWENWINDEKNYCYNEEKEPLLCGNSTTHMAGRCPIGWTCIRVGENPNNGYVSFDNVPTALLTLFGLTVQDCWEDFYFMTVRAGGQSYSFIYYVLGVYGVSFYLLNLILAVVATKYEEQREAVLQEEERISEAIKRKRDIVLQNDPENIDNYINRIKEDSADKEINPDIKEKLQQYCVWTCFPWNYLRRLLYEIQNDPFFDLFIIICILANAITMAGDGQPVTKEYDNWSTQVNDFFVWIFTGEMVIKLIGLQPYKYFQDSWNIFDFTIVSVSLIEKFVEGMGNVSVLRAFRAFRIFKLAKNWKTMNKLLRIIGDTIGNLINLTMVLFLVLFIFSIVGMQLFGPDHHKIIEEAMKCPFSHLERPRWHMADFVHAFLTGFRILCGEWLEQMWDCMDWSTSEILKATCMPIFIFQMIIGNLVLLNLFLALLMSGFGTDSLKEDLVEEAPNSIELSMHRIRRWITWFKNRITRRSLEGLKSAHEAAAEKRANKRKRAEQRKKNEEMRKKKRLSRGVYGADKEDMGDNFDKNQEDPPESKALLNIPSAFPKRKDTLENDADEDADKISVASFKSNISRAASVKSMISDVTFRTPENLPNNNTLVDKKWFKHMILVTILLSSLSLAVEDIYQYRRPTFMLILRYLDKIYTAIFVSEMILKIRCWGARRYFTNAWCILDCIIVISSLLFLMAEFFGFQQLSWIKQLRTLRALRPARALSRNEGTKVVINALVGAIPSFFNVVLVCMILWLIFSIIGVSLFSGKFAKCVWTENDTMLPPKYRYDAFEHFITDNFELSQHYSEETNLTIQNNNNNNPIQEHLWDEVVTFLEREKRDIYYNQTVNFQYYDGKMMNLDYLLTSYRNYRTGNLWLPQVDSKTPKIKVDAWQITKDSCTAIGELSIFMNCKKKNLTNFTAADGKLGRQQYNDQIGICVTNQIDPETDYRWKINPINFDDILNGLLALLHLATFMGWAELLSAGSDSTRMYQQPEFEHSMASISYFIIFIILGSFFTLNLYIGVIIDNFNDQKEKQGKSIFKTESQMIHSNILRKFAHSKPQFIPEPKIPELKFFYDLFKKRCYELFIMGIIFLNVIVMTFEHEGQSEDYERVLFRINIGFSAFFSTEILLKLLTYSPYHFFKNAWSVLDLIIEATTFLSMLLESIFTSLNLPSGLIRLLRLLRISRVLRLVKKAKGVKTLLHALIMSGPALFNVSLLLILIVLIFSLFAMANFPWVINGGSLNDIFNFKTFYSSFLSLFAVTTSAAWDLFLLPMLSEPPDCDPNWQPYDTFNKTVLPIPANGNCGVSAAAKAFFVLFILLSFMIVVNIYIAVILENYEIAIKESMEPIEDQDYEMYYEVWKKFATDPDDEHTIRHEQLSDLVDALHGNLRIAKPNGRILCELNPPLLENGKIHFSDVLCILMRKVLAYGDDEFDKFFQMLIDKKIIKMTRPKKSDYVGYYRTNYPETLLSMKESNVLGTNI